MLSLIFLYLSSVVISYFLIRFFVKIYQDGRWCYKDRGFALFFSLWPIFNIAVVFFVVILAISTIRDTFWDKECKW